LSVGSKSSSGLRQKLIESKKERARSARLLTGEKITGERKRLPPGQRLVREWPVLDLGVTPKITKEKWRLRVDGLVEKRLILRWEDFLALPQIELTSDIHCVTGWSRFNNRWKGVSAKHLVFMVTVAKEATHCVLHCTDGYTTNVLIDRFRADDVILAHSWNGAPLTIAHGGPLRVVLPQWYFWKSAKWIRRIEFVSADRPGFWESRGYHNYGNPWNEERYQE
jgi:DMSO/TMAO reductase YedYZ molybdopterin-dependent catalytic subunit